MKKLWKYLRGYTWDSILGPLFKLFEATLELIVPLVIAKIVDVGIGSGDHSYIIKMCLVLVALGAIGLAFSVTAQYLCARASVGFITRVRHEIFAHVGRLSYTDLDTLGTSTLITRMTADSQRVQTGLNLTLRLLLRSPFVVFGAMIMAFTIDAASGVSFALTIPLLSIVIFGIMLITTPLFKKVQNGVDKILARTRENLSGARVVRAFAKEESEVAAYRAENERLTDAQKHAGHISALLNPLTYVIINLGIIFLIYTGAVRVDIGELTQGEVLALYNYMSQILVELIKLANLIISVTKALASASRISAVLSTEPSQSFGEVTEGVTGAPAVEMKNASIRYKGAGDESLSDVSFTARRGEFIGIIGGTGSGKSTLINLIPRFYDATGGEVLIDGVPVQDYAEGVLTKKIAVVPQRAELFSGTVRDNLTWRRPDATDEELYRALEISEARGFIEDKGGLTARCEGGGKNFSGGQRQRLTIARALVGEPEILILDDSTSALDYATDLRLRTSLKKLTDTTVFIVSQRTASVMSCDKIIVLEDGEIEAVGTHENLLSTSTVYREIYDSQFMGGDDYE